MVFRFVSPIAAKCPDNSNQASSNGSDHCDDQCGDLSGDSNPFVLRSVVEFRTINNANESQQNEEAEANHNSPKKAEERADDDTENSLTSFAHSNHLTNEARGLSFPIEPTARLTPAMARIHRDTACCTRKTVP